MAAHRIYISGPMTGYPSFNFPAFEQAANMLRAIGYDVVSPHEFGEEGEGKSWADYLREDLIAMLDGCTAVATLTGWEESRGAQLEVHVASALEMRVERLEWWAAQPVFGSAV
ncbi:DUF4406 domain-containing protein [Gordonia insulae]|uniref:DUF4406 domain-containing protein n=1 Tax=Gordonia insulae TaxID=2420509 RepID=A0A3G8JEF4_9ACTN|nr:DUF4406 domain-containing protein [Gordonia insulae]AZG43467.1 hypothetical protein D7316_00031 [Gordonia insulae]